MLPEKGGVGSEGSKDRLMLDGLWNSFFIIIYFSTINIGLYIYGIYFVTRLNYNFRVGLLQDM